MLQIILTIIGHFSLILMCRFIFQSVDMHFFTILYNNYVNSFSRRYPLVATSVVILFNFIRTFRKIKKNQEFDTTRAGNDLSNAKRLSVRSLDRSIRMPRSSEYYFIDLVPQPGIQITIDCAKELNIQLRRLIKSRRNTKSIICNRTCNRYRHDSNPPNEQYYWETRR